MQESSELPFWHLLLDHVLLELHYPLDLGCVQYVPHEGRVRDVSNDAISAMLPKSVLVEIHMAFTALTANKKEM